jgi:hypothetical protein
LKAVGLLPLLLSLSLSLSQPFINARLSQLFFFITAFAVVSIGLYALLLCDKLIKLEEAVTKIGEKCVSGMKPLFSSVKQKQQKGRCDARKANGNQAERPCYLCSSGRLTVWLANAVHVAAGTAHFKSTFIEIDVSNARRRSMFLEAQKGEEKGRKEKRHRSMW